MDYRVGYAEIFALAVRFQNQDQFWVSRQKNQVSFLFLFFRNVEKWDRTAKTVFLAILAKIQSFSDNSDIIANFSSYEHITSLYGQI